MSENIKYPYLPKGKTILYVPKYHKYMKLAKEFARKYSLDKNMPNAVIIVNNGIVVGQGANGSDYHDKHGCERIRQNIPTGQRYDLCEGCHPKNHGEAKAIANAKADDLKDSDLYLYGHWWLCKDCWDVIIAAGIKNVYLLENSQVLFNKDNSDNIIGKQFSTGDCPDCKKGELTLWPSPEEYKCSNGDCGSRFSIDTEGKEVKRIPNR